MTYAGSRGVLLNKRAFLTKIKDDYRPMENYSEKPKTRRKKIIFRVNDAEEYAIYDGHYAAGYDGTRSAYFREVLIGDRIHPNFKYLTSDRALRAKYRNVGQLRGPDEIRNHVEASVLAAHFVQIQMDPSFRKLLTEYDDVFRRYEDDIRGYKYNPDTQEKFPLDGEFSPDEVLPPSATSWLHPDKNND